VNLNIAIQVYKTKMNLSYYKVSIPQNKDENIGTFALVCTRMKYHSLIVRFTKILPSSIYLLSKYLVNGQSDKQI